MPLEIDLAKAAYDEMFGDGEFKIRREYSTGCTDMGDLSSIMPVIHPYAGGAEGTSHGANYRIINAQRACVDSAKWQILMARRLLENDAALAKSIIADYKPLFGSIREFLDYQDAIMASGDRITYTDDGATIKL